MSSSKKSIPTPTQKSKSPQIYSPVNTVFEFGNTEYAKAKKASVDYDNKLKTQKLNEEILDTVFK